MLLLEIQTIVESIISDKLSINESEITPNANFIRDLNADSLDVSELIMEFEKKFNISIPDDQFKKIRTVNDAIKYIYIAINEA